MSTQTATAPVVQPTRPWRIYRIRSWRTTLLWLGITQQDAPIGRLEQHIGLLEEDGIGGGVRAKKKWWAPLAASWVVAPEAYATKALAEAEEARLIRLEKPRCNEMHNQGNSKRWETRDDVPAGEWPDGAVLTSLPRPPFWTLRTAGLAGVGALWLFVYTDLWTATGSWWAAGILMVPALLLAWWLGKAWKRSRPKRRRRRR